MCRSPNCTSNTAKTNARASSFIPVRRASHHITRLSLVITHWFLLATAVRQETKQKKQRNKKTLFQDMLGKYVHTHSADWNIVCAVSEELYWKRWFQKSVVVFIKCVSTREMASTIISKNTSLYELFSSDVDLSKKEFF